MKTKVVLIIACACALLAPASGYAMVTANDVASALAPSGLNWDYVYNYQLCSAVAVAPYWILTAAHVADDGLNGNLVIGSTTYTPQQIVYHPTADLALVRYDKALPGYYPLYTGSFPTTPSSARLSVILVGYGDVGTVSSGSWTDSGPGTGSGIERWGTQKIDLTVTGYQYNGGGIVGLRTSDGFWMDFSLSDTTNEAGVGWYDSGGGTFYNDNGTWKLAGINTFRGGTSPNFTSNFAVSVPAYASWINQTIPEPATLSMLALGGLALLRRRGRQSKRRTP